jgi:NAD(P)-dependent dehydrogenase (short-subunit alcohol dehydrogenase family)
MIVVTGATRGLGRLTAERLVRAGERVVGSARTDGAAAQLARKLGIEPLTLDLASVASVDAAATALAATGRTVRLIANAGIQVTEPTMSVDGVELTFAANLLGHLQLAQRLRDLGVRLDRLVLIGSGTHDAEQRTGMPRPIAPEVAALRTPPSQAGTESIRRYSSAKLAVVMAAAELARRWPDTLVLTFDPGLMPGTGLARGYGGLARLWWGTAMRALSVLPFASTATASSRHLARLATAESTFPTGSYVFLNRIGRTAVASRDEAAQRRLVDDSLALIDELRAAAAH